MLVERLPRALRGRLLAVVWTGALCLALALGPLVPVTVGADPTPSPTETPSATPSPAPTPTPVVIAYRRSLLRAGDFVHQYTSYQCVGASLQMMRNMIRGWNNRGPWLQRRLWRLAHAYSLYRADGGADPYGWTTASVRSSFGPYVLFATATMADAVRAAARGIATTGRPAGLIVWNGRHAWVLTGVEATANPATTDAFRVVYVRMADPLWPYRRALGHRVYRPGTRLSLSALSRNYTPYHDARRDPRIEGRYVVIVPVASGATLPTGAWSPVGMPAPSPTASPSATAAPAPTPSPTPPSDAGTVVAESTPGLTPTSTPTASPESSPTSAPSDGASAAP
jgi:hypothetical protein